MSLHTDFNQIERQPEASVVGFEVRKHVGALQPSARHVCSGRRLAQQPPCLMPQEGAANDMHGGYGAPRPLMPGQPLYPEVQDRPLEGHHVLCIHLQILRDAQAVSIRARTALLATHGSLHGPKQRPVFQTG